MLTNIDSLGVEQEPRENGESVGMVFSIGPEEKIHLTVGTVRPDSRDETVRTDRDGEMRSVCAGTGASPTPARNLVGEEGE